MSATRTTSMIAAALTAALFTVPTAVSAAPVLYAQPYASGNAWLSEDVSGQPTVWRVFDNFTLDGDGVVGRISFVGGYVDLSNSVYPAPDSTAFAFRFFADATGHPASAPLHVQTVDFGDVETSVLGTGTSGGFKTTVYAFAAELPVAFAATGGTNYWLSISSVAPAGDVQWAWFSGSGGDASSLQVLNGETDIWRGRDRAFTLESVPEPATLLMLTVGLSIRMR